MAVNHLRASTPSVPAPVRRGGVLLGEAARAEHAIEVEPTAVASGHLATSKTISLARSTTPDGTVSGIRTDSTLVVRSSRHRGRRGWRIIREHNSSQPLRVDEVNHLFATLPTS